MPLYRPLTAKSGKAWEDFKLLKSLLDDARKSLGYNAKRTDYAEAYMVRSAFQEMTDHATYLQETIKEAVRQLCDECCNWGAYTIEITKKNCAVDDDGNLILLDAVFDLAEVRAKYRKMTR
jgi:hypothetical protein